MEHKHMDHIKRVMDAYEEAQEELMGAQEYAKKMHYATDGENKSMYMMMARQELEHENKLLESGDREIRSMDADSHRELMDYIWGEMKKQLHHWRHSIEVKLEPTR
jgi:hypothetical protein